MTDRAVLRVCEEAVECYVVFTVPILGGALPGSEDIWDITHPWQDVDLGPFSVERQTKKDGSAH